MAGRSNDLGQHLEIVLNHFVRGIGENFEQNRKQLLNVVVELGK
jgi:hypothetical protein